MERHNVLSLSWISFTQQPGYPVDIVNAIAAGGYPVVGCHEKLPCPLSALQACSSLPFAFRKAA